MPMSALIYLAAVIVGSFIGSGVVPRYLAVKARRHRVAEFATKYREWTDAERAARPDRYTVNETEEAKAAELRSWLAARRSEMQRDAESVGKGIIHVAPPPAVGGGSYVPHSYFADLFDQQSFTDHGWGFRLDELATISHELEWQETGYRRGLFNPWAWIRLTFERIVGFPRYVLRHAGFSAKATESAPARVVSVVWSLLVGGAGIGGFVLTLLDA